MPELILVIGANATGKTHFIQRQYQDQSVECFDVYDYQQRAYDEAGYENAISLFDARYFVLENQYKRKPFRCL